MLDVLVARRSGRGAQLDRRTHIIELEVVCLRTYLEDPYLVLGVAGVGHPLGTHGLVGVVARARNVEGLIYVSAFGFLLEVAEAVEDPDVGLGGGVEEHQQHGQNPEYDQ